MGMNWGSFAGGLAEGAKSTWKQIRDEEERELLLEEKRQALQAKKDAAIAARDTLGRAGSEIQDQNLQTYGGMGAAQAKALDAQTAGMDDQAGIARQTIDSARYAAGAPQTAIPSELKGRTYTDSEAMLDYGRRMAAIDPDKAIAANMNARAMRKLDREEKKENKLDALADEAANRMVQVQTLKPEIGMHRLAELANKNGLSVEFVEAKDEMSPGAIRYTDPSSGKKVEITNFADAQNALGQAVMMDYLTKSQLHVSPKDAMQMLKDRSALVLANRADARAERADVREELAAPGKRELTAAQTAEAKGKGSYYDSGANYNNARIRELTENREHLNAAKPFVEKYNQLPPELRDGPEGQALLDQAEAAVAIKSGDFSKIKASTPLGRINGAYQEAAKEAAKNGLPPPNRVEFFAQAGYAAPHIMEGQQAKVNELVRVGKEQQAQALIKQHNATFPQTPLKMPPPSATRRAIDSIPR